MSEVAPLTKWSPLACMASFMRLNTGWLDMLKAVCSSRCDDVVVDESIGCECKRKSEVGRCLYSKLTLADAIHFCCELRFDDIAPSNCITSLPLFTAEGSGQALPVFLQSTSRLFCLSTPN